MNIENPAQNISQTELLSVLSDICSQIESVKRGAEATFEKWGKHNNVEVISMLFTVLEDTSISLEVRTSASKQLDVLFSTIQNIETGENTIDPHLQISIKGKILNIIIQAANENDLLDCLSNVFGKFVAKISDGQNSVETAWPELLPQLFALYDANNQGFIVLTLKLLGKVVLTSIKCNILKKDLAIISKIFKESLNQSNLDIKCEAATAIFQSVMLMKKSVKTKIMENIKDAIQTMFEGIKENHPLAIEMIETATVAMAMDADVFLTTLDPQLVIQVTETPTVSMPLKIKTFMFFTLMYNENEEIIPTEMSILLLGAIIKQISEICQPPTPEWCSPPEGFATEDGGDLETQQTSEWQGFADIIFEHTLEIQEIIQHFIAQQNENPFDWKYNYAVLMTLSMVAGHHNVNAADGFMDFTFRSFLHENPKIREAAGHAIGQLADSSEHPFHALYMDQVVPLLISGMDDSVPRVVSTATSALLNYFEKSETKIESHYRDSALEKAFRIMRGDAISFVKEDAVVLVTATALNVRKEFCKYIDEAMELLFNILNTKTEKEYQKLRGTTIESITKICISVGYKSIAHLFDQLVVILIQNQEKINEATSHMVITSVVQGWQFFAEIAPERLFEMLPRIWPSLCNIINILFEDSNQETPCKYTEENIGYALKMFSTFLQKFRKELGLFANEIIQICQKALRSGLNDEIVTSICMVLFRLTKKLKRDLIPETSFNTILLLEEIIRTFLDFQAKVDQENFIIVVQENLMKVIDIVNSDCLTSSILSELQVYIKKYIEALSPKFERYYLKLSERKNKIKDENEEDSESEESFDDEKLSFLNLMKITQILIRHQPEFMGPTTIGILKSVPFTKLIEVEENPNIVNSGLVFLNNCLIHLSTEELFPVWEQISLWMEHNKMVAHFVRHPGQLYEIIASLAKNHPPLFEKRNKYYTEALLEHYEIFTRTPSLQPPGTTGYRDMNGNAVCCVLAGNYSHYDTDTTTKLIQMLINITWPRIIVQPDCILQYPRILDIIFQYHEQLFDDEKKFEENFRKVLRILERIRILPSLIENKDIVDKLLLLWNYFKTDDKLRTELDSHTDRPMMNLKRFMKALQNEVN